MVAPPVTVLVVDDDPDLRRLLRQLLREAGYRVRLASHGLEALVQLQREPVALILLDLNMPGMSGWDCLAALRAVQHAVPVVLMTAG